MSWPHWLSTRISRCTRQAAVWFKFYYFDLRQEICEFNYSRDVLAPMLELKKKMEKETKGSHNYNTSSSSGSIGDVYNLLNVTFSHS